jgi:hypothetical protein
MDPAITEDNLRSRLIVIRNVGSDRVLGVDRYSMTSAPVHARLPKDYPHTQDSLIWVFGKGSFQDGVEIINKKSGLYLGNYNAAGQTFSQAPSTFYNDPSRGRVSGPPAVWRLRRDARPGVYKLVCTKFLGGPEIDDKTVYLSQNGMDTSARVDERRMGAGVGDHWFLWKLDDPSSLQAGYEPLEFPAHDRAAAKAGIVLAGLADLARTVGEIAEAAENPQVAMAAFAVSGAVKIGEMIADLFEASEDEMQDSLRFLYSALLPAMQNIVKQEIAIDNITDALGWAAAARLAFNQANMQLTQAAMAAGLNPDKVQKMSASQLREKIGPDLVGLSFEQLSMADHWYRVCLGQLMVQKQRQLALPAWTQVAAEHVSLYAWRMVLAPDQYSYPFMSLIQQYLDFATNECGIVLGTRIDQIKDGKDTFYTTSDNQLSGTEDDYVKHVTRVTMLAFGNPDSFIAKLEDLDEKSSKLVLKQVPTSRWEPRPKFTPPRPRMPK